MRVDGAQELFQFLFQIRQIDLGHVAGRLFNMNDNTKPSTIQNPATEITFVYIIRIQACRQ